MSARQPAEQPQTGYKGLLTLQEQMQFAGLEGSLTWIVQELRALAETDQPTHGLTSEEWAELAEAGDQFRESITDWLNFIAKCKAGGP